MEQSGFDFAVPPVDPSTTSPTGEALPPIAGRTTESRHASYTGAVQAAKLLTAKRSEYLQILTNGSGISDHEAAAVMKCGLSSICSIRNGLIDDGYAIEADGFDLAQWADGGTTRRTHWTLKKEVRAMSDDERPDQEATDQATTDQAQDATSEPAPASTEGDDTTTKSE